MTRRETRGGLRPANAAILDPLDHESLWRQPQLYLFSKVSLFEKGLGNPNTLRVADSYDLGLHGASRDGVITMYPPSVCSGSATCAPPGSAVRGQSRAAVRVASDILKREFSGAGE